MEMGEGYCMASAARRIQSGGRRMSRLYIVDGTFSALVEAESEEDAKVSFDPMDIDDYRILSVEAEEEDE
jgi:hypothetical protein